MRVDKQIRCVWCDSAELKIFSENLFKCSICGKFTDDEDTVKLEKFRQPGTQRD